MHSILLALQQRLILIKAIFEPIHPKAVPVILAIAIPSARSSLPFVSLR